MPQEAIDILKQYGLAGVVIGFLAFAVYKLYVRNQELHASLNELGRESVRANEQMTSALNQMAEANRATVGAILQVSDNVKQLLWRHGLKAGE
jgi:Zn-dependent protease with chaperone function